MSIRRADTNIVEVPGDETFDLLRMGQQVETPLGSGVVKEIALQAARYGDRIELEPPAITVRLDDPAEGIPAEIVVCMCKLGLKNTKHEAIIRKEFARLWPPISDDVPKDIHMLMDLNKQQKDLDKFGPGSSRMSKPRNVLPPLPYANVSSGSFIVITLH